MKTPAHLEAFPWYAKHQSWLASHRFSHHEFPDGTTAERATLTGANLFRATLTGAILRGANLTEAILRGAILRGADLAGADLTEADLREADLRGADLAGADLTEADLAGADLTEAILRGTILTGAILREAHLTGADLAGADLTGAILTKTKGIVSFCPCPGSGRIGYAVLHEDCIMVQLGCWWNTLENTVEILKEKRTPAYVALVEAAALVLQEQKEVQ